MNDSVTLNTSIIQQWIDDGLETENIRNEMRALGHDDPFIEAHIKEFKRLKYSKRQSKGFIYAGIGAVMGFVSCVLTLVNPVPELYYFILYGFTSAAIIVIFLGLYFIFE